MNADGIKFQK